MMDAWTRVLLGATLMAVVSYVGLVYGGCALDPDCHFRTCGKRSLCGVITEPARPR